MANSVDTFKLYVQSLDSSSSAANQQQQHQPPKPKRSEPISVPADDADAAFDTSYVDKVIFRTGGDEDFPVVGEEEEEEEVFALDPAFASFRSEVSVGVAEIDSGLQSPDNAYGSSLRPGRPDFLQLSSFMIWNDPDAVANNNSTGGAPSTSVSPSASSSQLNASNQNSANQQNLQQGYPQQNLRLPGAHKSTFGQLAVSPTESPLSSPEPQPHPPQSSAALNTSNTSSAGKTMRRRGLFSWNTSNAQLQNSGGGGHSEPAQLEVNLSGGTSEKSPKSPTTTTTNGGGNMGGSVVSLHSNSATTSSSGAGPQLGTQLEDEDRFNGDGVQFHGKLIGSEYVAEARGEQMCQQSLKKLKIIQKAMGGHKRRIHLYISFDGIKIADALSAEQLFHHTVPQISFISRDETDTRAFGYVFGNSTTGHQFIGIKTKKEAMVVMTTIGQLFSITLKRKRSAEEAAALAIAESIKEDYKEYYKTAEGGSEDHIYHTMYGGVGGGSGGDMLQGKTGTSTSTRNRSRTTSQNSAEVIIPALLPPPTAADFGAGVAGVSGGAAGHHHHHHRSRGQASSNSSVSTLQPASAVVKLAPPPSSSSAAGGPVPNANSAADVPVFSSYMPYMPSGGANLGASGGGGNQPTAAAAEWANFDDDAHFGGGSSVAAQNNNSVMDDSTLNTISSLSSEAMPSGLFAGSSSSGGSKTLSAQNDLSSASATLVGPRSGQPMGPPLGNSNLGPGSAKNHPRNGSSSTIASGTFDGADPFSDAFGTDDPFSGSMAVGGGSGGINIGGGDLSASGGSLGNVKSHDALSSQFAGMNLESSSANNLSSSLNLSKSVDSTSSADRYAALADIHNLSNSIFDSFGNKKTDVARGGGENNKSANLFASSQSASIPMVATTTAAAAQNLFASQGGQFTVSAFQPQQQQQQQQPPFSSHHSAMYGQPLSVAAYQTAPGGAFITTTAAGPMVMGGGSGIPVTSQQQFGQFSHPSTTSLPGAFGQPQPQQQQQFYQQQQLYQQQQPQLQFMPSTSPGYVMASPVVTMMTTSPHPQQQQQPMMMTRNSSAPMMQQGFTAVNSGGGQNVGSTSSINSMPLFEDLDILGKKKIGGGSGGFGMKSEPMFQQQSLDSFTRNQMATAATGNASTTNPFM